MTVTHPNLASVAFVATSRTERCPSGGRSVYTTSLKTLLTTPLTPSIVLWRPRASVMGAFVRALEPQKVTFCRETEPYVVTWATWSVLTSILCEPGTVARCVCPQRVNGSFLPTAFGLYEAQEMVEPTTVSPEPLARF